MSQCAGDNCTHSSHADPPAATQEALAQRVEELQEQAKAAPPAQIGTVAQRRFDRLTSTRHAREEARKAEANAPPAPAAEPPPKPTYEPSAGVKSTQKLLEVIERKRNERANLIAAKLRRTTEFERADREAKELLDKAIADLEEDLRNKVAALKDAYGWEVTKRFNELVMRQDEIEKLDHSLVELRKELDAHLGKLDPELARPRKGA